MPLNQSKFSRVKTLRGLIHDLQELVNKHPDLGDTMVCTVHSASGAPDHINSFRVSTLTQNDLDDEYGCFYEDEGLVAGEKVIRLSVGGN